MNNENLPTRTQAIIFRAKASLFQIKRGIENLFNSNLKQFLPTENLADKTIIAESITPLWTEKDEAEQFLLAGKIHNLRLAVRKLNGIVIPANKVFSFWKQVGKTTAWRGYVAGRELREGCIIPNIGGGLCQISNALYDAALKANFKIVERYAHTQVVQGSLAEQGRDATVFWNYVDLRFKSPTDFRIEATLDAENLIVRFLGEKQEKKQFIQIQKLKTQNSKLKTDDEHHPNSCATCGVNDCFRVIKPHKNSHNFGRTAYLVDEFSPEFDEYIQKNRQEKDVLFIPLDGKRFKKANYAWTTKGFHKVNQSFFVTAIRSYKSRKLATQGASRQKNLLAMYEKLAEDYAKSLKYDALHVVVQQNLLPFLWKNGYLGGRTFDVLMTALPMKNLQERLDFAKKLHPESSTLGDFRAENWLLEAETEALKNARKIITPHTEIASIFADKAEILNWQIPNREQNKAKKNSKLKIVFPASTVGRKGVYELREAIKNLDVKLITVGSQIESNDFWQGFDVENRSASNGWLDDANLVVMPAFVEHKPRRIIEANARKIPVIASRACGVENLANVEIVEVGDVKGLREKILKQI
jgi:glycosyltransferase involved in cell wall biosynthesis